MTVDRARCYFDVEVDGVPLGRIVFELFSEVCPKTAENFRSLCTGERGIGKTTEKALHYKGVKFHRVIKDFMVQAGDFTSRNGTGGESVYGGHFEDENFEINHEAPFLLSMANKGKDTNGSQFFITTQPASHLDGKHVVFGRVITGQEVVVSIENLPVDNRSRPLQPAIIIGCGQLMLQRSGKVKSKEKKKRRKVDSDISEDEKKKKKRKKDKGKVKDKKPKKEIKIFANEEEEGELTDADLLENNFKTNQLTATYIAHPLSTVSVINPEEIPEVPKNRFLDRGYQNRQTHNTSDGQQQSGRLKSQASVRFYTKSGRKVKGRGSLRYRTPSRSRSPSRSITPPHWRQAQSKTVSLETYQREALYQQQREKQIEDRRQRREERHRLQERGEDAEEEEGEWGGHLHQGNRERSTGREYPQNDWRRARLETQAKESVKSDHNRKDSIDLRSKLENNEKSYNKENIERKKERSKNDGVELDDTALDYEISSDNDDEEEDAKENGNEEETFQNNEGLTSTSNRNRKLSSYERRSPHRDYHRDRSRTERDRYTSRSRDRRRDSRSRQRKRSGNSRDRSRDRNRRSDGRRGRRTADDGTKSSRSRPRNRSIDRSHDYSKRRDKYKRDSSAVSE